MKLEGRFWITHNGKDLAGERRIALLSRIDSTGSISQAAKAVGVSYKFAWDSVDAMNAAAGSPLVERSAGGKGGGGTRLTPAGHALIEAFHRYEREHQLFLERLGEDAGISSFLEIMERLRMKTSARNQLFGKVSSIQRGEVNDQVEFHLDSGDRLLASITNDSTERLGLEVGEAIYALIKASWVLLVDSDFAPNDPSDNLLRGEVRQTIRGAAETEVEIELPGGAHIAAVLSNEHADGLELSIGKPVAALIKASHIILGRF
ncbi:LysR family transcriptional regulator [Pseudomonas cavernicola]|uniref:LysR family transcriptional regulator n=1 Tax=Pseudomonas cavernicola TaxID=2320866 RepID=A0A418XNW8_9PSED|nr:TOBE domain-containing protein [Pseudomonas cavernicola]RJG14148.1 LysR family transcriptional regulator [Pseudomonas cavernicola]